MSCLRMETGSLEDLLELTDWALAESGGMAVIAEARKLIKYYSITAMASLSTQAQ